MSSARGAAQWKMNSKKRLMALIYDPFDKYFERIIGELIVENDSLLRVRHYIFMHRGVRYTQVRFAKPPQRIPRLEPELVPKMDALLEEKEAIERQERHYVMSYVTRLLNHTDDVGTFLEGLPKPFVRAFEDVLEQNPEVKRSELDLDEAGIAVGVTQPVIDALKVRLMTNLIMGDR